MRILRVAQKVYPEVPGGGTYHVHALSRDQAAMGHDVTVLTVRTDPSLPHVDRRDGYTVVRFDPTVTLIGNAISAGVGQYLRAAEGFDVVHAHSHLYASTNLAALNRRLGDTPLAITNHGLYSQTAPAWLFDLYLRTMGRWTFNRADVVFCYSGTDRDRLRAFGVDARIAVVPNGVDLERFRPDGPRSDRLAGDGRSVLFVGRLVEGKRPDIALRAVAHARERDGADLELYLCGDGPRRSDLETLAETLGIDDAVHFLGQVPYEEMPAVYRSADVLVLPSRSEGLPRTVLEAIAAGVPVVCSQLEQLRDIVGEGERGALVDVGDASELARALVRWSDGTRRPAPLQETHAWRTTVAETTDVLQSLVRGD